MKLKNHKKVRTRGSGWSPRLSRRSVTAEKSTATKLSPASTTSDEPAASTAEKLVKASASQAVMANTRSRDCSTGGNQSHPRIHALPRVRAMWLPPYHRTPPRTSSHR